MLRDPALLVWLDAPTNRKGHPNENLARELMELFTLGIGHYSEDDVKEAARALTGRKVDGEGSRFVPARHDDGEQDDPRPVRDLSDVDGLADLLLDQPRRRRDGWPGGSVATFFGEGGVGDDRDRCPGRRAAGPRPGCRLGRRDGAPLAGVLRGGEPSRSRGPGRSGSSSAPCGRWRCSTRRRARWCWPTGAGGWARTLFDPPNVGGWPGGRAWINTRSAIGRANFAAALIAGTPRRPPLDVRPDRPGRSVWPGAAIRTFFARLLLGSDRPEVPLSDAGIGPAGIGSVAGLAFVAADLNDAFHHRDTEAQRKTRD